MFQEILQKAKRGTELPGHKYLARVPDGKGGWDYKYVSTGFQQKLPLGGGKQGELTFDKGKQAGPAHAQDQRGVELAQKHPKEIADFSHLEARSNAVYSRQGSLGSRHTPAEYPNVPVGTWAREAYSGLYGHDLWQLQEIDPHDSRIQTTENNVEINTEGRGDDARRYAEWMRDDAVRSTAPPIQLLEVNGKLRVTDGHRRLAAAKLADKPIRAWVSPETETGKHDFEGKPINAALTHEIVIHNALLRGEKVPDTVLAAYPDLRKRMDDERKDFAQTQEIVAKVKAKPKTAAQVNAVFQEAIGHMQQAQPGQGTPEQRKAARDKASALVATLSRAEAVKVDDDVFARWTAIV